MTSPYDHLEETLGRIDFAGGFYFVNLGKREPASLKEWRKVAELIAPFLPDEKSIVDIKEELDADECAVFRLRAPVAGGTA